MKRIAMKDLEAVVTRINIMTKSPEVPWTRDKSGKFKANIGCYHLDQAYGGVALYQMDTEGGGIRDVLQVGHQSKRELLHLMHAYIRGLEADGRRK